MDDLEALEKATAARPMSSADGAGGGRESRRESAVKRALDAPTLAPKRQKRRWPSSSPASSAPASPAGAIVQYGDGDGVVVGNAAAADDDDDANNGSLPGKICLGCKRTYMSFDGLMGNLTTLVPWALPKGRGAWCDLCHKCHRTCFAHEHSLQLFGTWLRDDVNFVKWTFYLAAYASLVMEACHRITFDMVKERMVIIRFALGLFGFPASPSVVQPITAHTAGPPPDCRALCNMAVDWTPRIGMFVDFDVAASISSKFTFKRPGSASFLHPWTLLHSEVDDDREILAGWYPGAAESFSSVHATPDDICVAGTSRLAMKLSNIVSAFKPVLAMFTTAMWSSTKESSLTVYLTKFQSLHGEASVVGEGAVIYIADEWIVGLRNLKAFLSRYRTYAKTKYKHAMLLECSASLFGFRSFFIGKHVQLKFATNLELLWHRLNFFQHASVKIAEHGFFLYLAASGLETTLKNGLIDCVGSEPSPHDSRVAFSAWARSTLYIVFAEQVTNATTGDEGILKTLLEDANACIRLLKGFDVASEMICDVTNYATLLQCSVMPTDVVPSTLSAAMDNIMNTSRFKILKDALTESEAGKSILSAASCLVQLSSKDSLADGKLAVAISGMSDDRLPKLSIPPPGADCECSIDNFALLSDMGIVEIMTESLCHATHAFALWSPFRMEQQSTRVLTWIEDLVKSIVFYDAMLSIYLQALIGQGKMATVLYGDGGGFVNDEVAAFAELQSRLQEADFDDDPLRGFIHTLMTALNNSPDIIKRNIQCHDAFDVLNTKVLPNIHSREQIVEFLVCAAHLPELPLSAQAALDEWHAKQAIGAEQSSYLVSGSAMLTTFSALRTAILNVRIYVGHEISIIIFDDGDRGVSFRGSLERAKSLTEDLLQLSLPPFVLDLAGQSTQLVLNSYIASLQTRSLLPGKLPDVVGDERVVECIDLLVDKEAIAESMKFTAMMFSDAKNDHVWPSDALHALLRTLLASMPVVGFELSIHELCNVDGGSTPRPVPLPEARLCVDQVCVLYSSASHVALALAFLQTKFISGSEGCIRDHKLKSDIENAINFVRQTVSKLLQTIDGPEFSAFETHYSDMPWLLSKAACKQFLLSVQALTPSICRWCIVRLVADMDAVSIDLANQTPAWNHYISDTNFLPLMAKKNLLQWPWRKQLNETAAAMFGMIADSSRLHTSWGLQPSLRADDEFGETMFLASTLFGSAKTAITMIACCSVLLEKKGDDRASQALTLLQHKREVLPKTIITELEKAAATANQTTTGISGKDTKLKKTEK